MELYRLLLKLYPARFREEFEGPLARQFADEYREIPTRTARAWFWLRALLDLATSIPGEILRELRQDLRYALRVYRNRALVTTLAVTALALAIGATTGVFSVVSALLLRSLPFGDPERLVQVAHFEHIAIEVSERSRFEHWWRQSPIWKNMAVYRSEEMNLDRAGQALRARVTETSGGFFDTLQTKLAIGRPYTADEDLPGKDAVAVIGYATWQQLFGGDAHVLGASLHLNGTALTIIGVAPPEFDFPTQTSIWTPTRFDDKLIPRTFENFPEVVGRLQPGISIARANDSYQALQRHSMPDEEQLDPERRTRLVSLQNQLAGKVREASFVLLAAVVFVLLIACANVAQLLLSRIVDRRPELAIRASLGASRSRMIQQLITEATLLTVTATALGLLIAHWAARLATAAQPGSLSTQHYTVLDWRVLAFSSALAIFTGLAFGVLPALMIGRLQPSADFLRMQNSGSSTVNRMRALLVALQIGLAVVLVAGSITMARRFQTLAGSDLGIHTPQVVTMRVSLLGTRFAPDPQAMQFYTQALDRLRAVPGVLSAGAADYLPLVPKTIPIAKPQLDSGQSVWAAPISIAPGYFRTLQTTLIAGRDFTEADRFGVTPVAIVNDQFVRTAHAGSNLLGRTLKGVWDAPYDKPFTIVGIVHATRFAPDDAPMAQLYVPIAQVPPSFATLVARVQGDPERLLAICRDAIRQVDAQLPVYDVKTFDERLREELAKPRFYTTAVLFFGAFALLLAMIGTYGAVSYTISRRTHEMGVRLAIGATPGGLRGMITRQSLLPVAGGVAVGIAGATALGRFVGYLLAGTEPLGIAMCATAACALALTAAIAIWSATRRIVTMDPTAALRVE